MPRLTKSQPKYRKHRASGQAVVELSGKDFYLGPYGTAASYAEYDRLVGEWMANGRQLQREKARSNITVAELLIAYWSHAKAYYRNPDGSEAGELDNQRQAFRPLKRLYSHILAADFGPLSLKAVQQEMVKLGWCRSYLNKQVSRVKMLFKWGVSQELVPPSVFHGLQAVAGLRRGRSDARESEPVKPVPEAYVDAILPLVAPQVKAMIELQLLTGMRPGEVCCMRGVDLDTSGAIWIYKPAHHKTEHHGHSREIWLGPKAQAIVQAYLKPDMTAYLFSPQEAEASRHAEARGHRRPDQKPNPRKTCRQLGDRYDVNAYRRAIARGCDAAFAPPDPLPRLRVKSEKGEGATRWETKAEWQARLGAEKWAELRKWLSEHRWHPHQLRHNAATRLRREYGIEAARVILGHHSLEVTEIYAEKDVAKAKQIMAEVG